VRHHGGWLDLDLDLDLGFVLCKALDLDLEFVLLCPTRRVCLYSVGRIVDGAMALITIIEIDRRSGESTDVKIQAVG
jgi:hypothetical protein